MSTTIVDDCVNEKEKSDYDLENNDDENNAADRCWKHHCCEDPSALSPLPPPEQPISCPHKCKGTVAYSDWKKLPNVTNMLQGSRQADQLTCRAKEHAGV